MNAPARHESRKLGGPRDKTTMTRQIAKLVRAVVESKRALETAPTYEIGGKRYFGIPAPFNPRTAPGCYVWRKLRFADPLVEEALTAKQSARARRRGEPAPRSLEIALLAVLVGLQRAHGRPSDDGESDGVTASFLELASHHDVIEHFGRSPKPREVRAALERLRRYGFEVHVGQRFEVNGSGRLHRVHVREILPGVDTERAAGIVVVPFSEQAHEQAEIDLARPGKGGKREQSRGPEGRFSVRKAGSDSRKAGSDSGSQVLDVAGPTAKPAVYSSDSQFSDRLPSEDAALGALQDLFESAEAQPTSPIDTRASPDLRRTGT